MKTRCLAMILAGGQGSRLGVLTMGVAKPAVAFGGKYRIIDFPLSNCINSGIDTVGVLTQYQPLRLNTHIGIGIPWDLDRNYGGVTVLPPYESTAESEWYTGTANAIYQNMRFMDIYDPEYVLILSGDHILKMDYEVMLDYHKEKGADVTIAAMQVPWEEASRFGIIVTDEDRRITEFQEKPADPKSDMASMGIYIFTYSVLKEALETLKDVPNCDFGKHVIPFCHEGAKALYTYQFQGYWRDVGTLTSYWEANMGLIDLVPEFNLYEERWNIYTQNDALPPHFIDASARVQRCILGEGSTVFGEVYGSVIGPNVHIGNGAKITNSIIMKDTRIGDGCVIDKAIIGEGSVVGEDTVMGGGEYAESKLDTKVYASDLVTVGDNSVIPGHVSIGKNTAIAGRTQIEDYPDLKLEAGGFIVKAGETV